MATGMVDFTKEWQEVRDWCRKFSAADPYWQDPPPPKVAIIKWPVPCAATSFSNPVEKNLDMEKKQV